MSKSVQMECPGVGRSSEVRVVSVQKRSPGSVRNVQFRMTAAEDQEVQAIDVQIEESIDPVTLE